MIVRNEEEEFSMKEKENPRSQPLCAVGYNEISKISVSAGIGEKLPRLGRL